VGGDGKREKNKSRTAVYGCCSTERGKATRANNPTVSRKNNRAVGEARQRGGKNICSGRKKGTKPCLTWWSEAGRRL